MPTIPGGLRRAVQNGRLYPYVKRIQALRPADRAARAMRHDFYRQFVAPGSLVFDVGANVGNRVEAFLALGARVVAVEPQPQCVQVLLSRWGHDPNLTVLAIGLDEKPGTSTLYIADHNVLSSMSRDYIEVTRYKDNQWDGGHEVRVTTLDALIDVFGDPDFVKVDVEGFEQSVLRGATRPLRALSFEVNPPSRHVALGCLDQLGDGYRYAWSAGESMRLDTGWMPLGEMRAHVETVEQFGDVYARRD